MIVYLVRHGETDYNKKGIVQGQLPIRLNKTGQSECMALRRKLNDVNFDYCFTSPLVRTFETAMLIVGHRVLIKRDDRLTERGLGKLEGKSIKGYQIEKLWDYKLNYTYDDIERIQDLFKRCNEFVCYLKENYSDKTILVVSHSSVIRCLHFILTNSDLNSDLTRFKVENCHLEKIEI